MQKLNATKRAGLHQVHCPSSGVIKASVHCDDEQDPQVQKLKAMHKARLAVRRLLRGARAKQKGGGQTETERFAQVRNPP